MEASNSGKPRVAIIKGSTPRDCVLKGIDLLGGISKFIDEEDQVFIKFNLFLPNGFPTNTNFDVLGAVIQACNNAGAKKIYVGCFPYKGFTIKTISDILGLESYIKSLGAELSFLDNSNRFGKMGSKEDQIIAVKNATMVETEINNQTYMVPRVIVNSDKLISLNQVNVHPIFKCRLSLLNSYSIIPFYNQEVRVSKKDIDNNLRDDKYKQELTSKIIDVFSIKKPNLVINDLYYILEGAGPFIYKDSKLKKTGVIIIGTNALSTDEVTLSLLKLNDLNNELSIAAVARGLGSIDLFDIEIIGENINDLNIDVELCVSKLEDINVKNLFIKTGQYCSGCYESAYHLLNLMKTNMVKDLKYISKNSFLIGNKPPEPQGLKNIIVFGDCAINSTKNYDFRKQSIQTKKKVKEKVNKSILELPGCPCNVFQCVEAIVNYYGKAEVPTLNLFLKTVKSYYFKKFRKNLYLWEVL